MPALFLLHTRLFLAEAAVAATRDDTLEPRVFWRLTDNWVEMSVRFICEAYGSRSLKDRMSRDILAPLDEAKIEIASSTSEITAFPPLRIDAANIVLADLRRNESRVSENGAAGSWQILLPMKDCSGRVRTHPCATQAREPLAPHFADRRSFLRSH